MCEYVYMKMCKWKVNMSLNCNNKSCGIIYVNWNETAIIDDLHYMIDNEMFPEVTKNSDNIVLHDSLKHKIT
jgi:hypothetical protein